MYSAEAIEFAKTHVGQSLLEIPRSLRKEISVVVLDAIGNQQHFRRLASELYHCFKDKASYDWEMIAATELGNVMNNGAIIRELNQGTRYLRGVSGRCACEFCKANVDRKVVVIGDEPIESGFVWDERLQRELPYLWPGKSNFSRRQWWVAAGVQHPWCVCSWNTYTPGFEKYMKELDDTLDRLV